MLRTQYLIFYLNQPINMSKTSIMMTTFYEPKLKGLEEQCYSRRITLVKKSNIQIEIAYALEGYKAVHNISHRYCFIFISYAANDRYNIAAFFEGKNILTQYSKQKKELPQIIEEALSKLGHQENWNAEQQMSKLQEMFGKLNKKSEEILKKSSNQLLAIQEIKSSNQYMTICNELKVLTLQIKQMCKIIEARQKKADMKNQKLIQVLEDIERKKRDLEELQYNYECLRQKVQNLNELFEEIIEKKKAQVDSLSNFQNEQGFQEYLDNLIALKTLQNQKKYIKRLNKSTIAF